jgi:hypothetical protein
MVGGVEVRNPYGLGALTPESAADTVFPASRVTSRVGFDQRERDGIVNSAQSGQIYVEPGWGSYCQGASGGLKPALLTTGGSLALRFAPQAFAAGPIVGGLVLLASGIMSVFGAIFGHHAKAYAREKSVVCAAVPAANDSLSVIDQAVRSGQITPQQAMTALDQVQSDFAATVGPIVKDDASHCNASCSYKRELAAVVALRKSQYQDLIAAQTATPGSGVVSPIAATLGIPTWAVWVGAAGLLYWAVS